jgi:thiamine biosynthesis lipoprotein
MADLISRRQVLSMAALGGLALGLGFDELHAVLKRGVHLTRVHETRLLMGTISTLTVISDQPEAARRAIDEAFGRMTSLEAILSRFQDSSQVSQLNRTGAITGAAPALQQVLAKASAVSEQTAGAFDVTVEPLLDAYRSAAVRGQIPDAAAIAELRTKVDYRAVKHSGDVIEFRQQGMAVTFDGLAKGYILDAGAETLLANGCANVLVEAGGDLMARGITETGGWRIGIQSPRGAAAADLIGTIAVENAALATSGDYQHQFRGSTHHHILDPQTGDSPAALSSVTVMAANACDADALSTALMVLSADHSADLLSALSGVGALLMDKHGAIVRSDLRLD